MIHLATLTSVLNNGWTEDFGTWLFGVIVGASLAHRHVVRPLRAHIAAQEQRHQELLAHHAKHADELAKLNRKVSP